MVGAFFFYMLVFQLNFSLFILSVSIFVSFSFHLKLTNSLSFGRSETLFICDILRKIICLFIRLLSASRRFFSHWWFMFCCWIYNSSFAYAVFLCNSLKKFLRRFLFSFIFTALSSHAFLCVISSLVRYIFFWSLVGAFALFFFGVANYFTFQCVYSVRVTQSCGFWVYFAY